MTLYSLYFGWKLFCCLFAQHLLVLDISEVVLPQPILLYAGKIFPCSETPPFWWPPPKRAWVLEEVLRFISLDRQLRKVNDDCRLYARILDSAYAKYCTHLGAKYLTNMEAMRRQTRNRFPESTPANLCFWCLDYTSRSMHWA